ncbi:MAG: hypothetical protein HKN07_16595 [Acidimicrobiia bacterium]|nr:hypothetical protein [Acidimicrobiia bacterium]
MNNSFRSLVVATVVSMFALAACGSSCEPTDVPLQVSQDGQTLVATFAEDVFGGDAGSTGEGLVVTLRTDDEEVGRWNATADEQAQGLVEGATVVDNRTVEIQLNGDVPSGVTLRIRPDSQGPCDGPAGSIDLTT